MARTLFVVVALVVLTAGAGIGFFVWYPSAPPLRHVTIGPATIYYDGGPALAIIVETRKGEVVSPCCYAMLGRSPGSLALPHTFPAGTDLILRFALDTDIVTNDTSSPARVVQSRTLRGIGGANTGEKLEFETGARETIMPLDGGPTEKTMWVHESGGKLTIGAK